MPVYLGMAKQTDDVVERFKLVMVDVMSSLYLLIR